MQPPERLAAETHVSWVFFAGDRALKLYKPVTTDVLDASTPERRRTLCEQEVSVNRRFSPDAYLGVSELAVEGSTVDHLVVMRRYADTERLSHRLATDPDAHDDDIRTVARRLAVIHGEAPTLDTDAAAAVATPDALAARIRADIAGLAELAGDRLPPGALDDLLEDAEAFLLGRHALLRERTEAGHVVDGHGDLLAEDIFLTAGGPVVLDALAFDDHLRHGDVLADLAFLVMDLLRLGHPRAARNLVHHYTEFSGERHPGSLAHYYVAQRAIVRAKVASLRLVDDQATEDDWTPVQDLVELAADHLDRAQVRLLLVGGIPGSGKTSLAASVADQLGWVHLSSDEQRRDMGLLGIGDDAYDDETKDRVYAALLEHARHLLEHGVSVVLDSAWDQDRRRESARSLAGLTSARLHEIRCVVPVGIARTRVAARPHGLSEADGDVVDAVAMAFDDWASALAVDTAEPLTRVVERVLTTLPARTWVRRR